MAELRREDLKNVLILALADGRVSDEEKEFVLRLQDRLGLDRAALAAIVEEVRQDPKAAPIPADTERATAAISLLAEAAAVDGDISSPERKFITDIAAWVGVDAAVVAEMLDAPQQQRQAQERADALTEEIYDGFAGWDAAARRAKVAELAALGRHAVVPLLRILESYRTPDGADEALELKTLAAEQIGQLGDKRAVYYLAQQVTIGDIEDEITSAALRSAAAAAVGKLVGASFAADSSGIQAARQWWLDTGHTQYNDLVI